MRFVQNICNWRGDTKNCVYCMKMIEIIIDW